MWENMLTPVHRVDHQTLLDANIAYTMFAVGVDRMHVTSEKYFAGGKAVMEMDCDRANPDADEYTVTVFDNQGRTLRRERYTRAEVEDSSQHLRGLTNIGPTDLKTLHIDAQATINIGPSTQPTTSPATLPTTTASTEPSTAAMTVGIYKLSPEEEKLLKECARRTAAAAAATQPARLVSPTGK